MQNANCFAFCVAGFVKRRFGFPSRCREPEATRLPRFGLSGQSLYAAIVLNVLSGKFPGAGAWVRARLLCMQFTQIARPSMCGC